MLKKTIASVSLAAGIGVTALLFVPAPSNANTNVVLASVEWVNSLINPLQSKVTSLETKIATQEQQIRELQAAISSGGNIPAPTPVPPSTELPSTVYTEKSGVTVHSGATRNYKVVETLSANKGLKVIDRHNGVDGLWYRVEVSASTKGWIYSGDVTTTKPSNYVPSQVIAKETINIRSGATTSYRVVETVVKGTSLKYLGQFKNAYGEVWYNVSMPNGKKGWVLSTLTEVK